MRQAAKAASGGLKAHSDLNRYNTGALAGVRKAGGGGGEGSFIISQHEIAYQYGCD